MRDVVMGLWLYSDENGDHAVLLADGQEDAWERLGRRGIHRRETYNSVQAVEDGQEVETFDGCLLRFFL
jgi:hypothetical protein